MSTSASYYGPVNETSSDILLEKTFMASGYLTGVGYGIQLVLYIACVQVLWERNDRSRSSLFLIGYLTILCLMDTLWTSTSAFGLQLTYIDNRNYPGGPLGFLGVEFALPSNVVSLASYITGNIMADALMIWRCYIVWSAARGSKVWYVLIVPCLMLVGSLILAILFGLETTGPAGLFASITASFAVPYFALSMCLNIILTGLIIGRIYFYQKRGHGVPGGSVRQASAIFVESAAMYSIVSFLLMVTFALGHPINQIWLGIAPPVQMIANYLIVYRVAQGRAFGKNTISLGSEANSTTHVEKGEDNQSSRNSEKTG